MRPERSGRVPPRPPATAGRRSEAPGIGTVLRSAVHPPVHDRRFWVVQATVVVIAAAHLVLDLNPSVETKAFPVGLPVVVLVVPVGYAAFRYGIAGSAATGALATLLWLPDLLLPYDLGHSASDVVNLVLVDLVALFVGHRIEALNLAHDRAERATLERLAAETRYARTLVEVEEDQRRRLARELHDEPLQLFLHLARRLESLADTPGTTPAAAHQLRDARGQALDAAARLRTLARSLRPPALDQLGLVAAVESLLADAEEEHGVLTVLTVSGDERPLPADVELGAFRIVQEAVRNTCRHAGARRLDVSLELGGDELAVAVADDGRGFSPDGPASGGADHLGLLGSRERARLLGGSFALRSAPGEGTVVGAVLPLPVAATPD